ncbi:hypothetical protein B484DRAFT_445651 [Ochromonadaceae sp. CCMP2298]|nr:hypothetical protein B484DRAFT_445651 [Ochromonadaceae sp. CCMP2298]
MQQEQQPAAGGHPNEMFVRPPPDFLRCGICMEIMRDPVLVCSNHHAYCRGCFAQWEQAANTNCPLCLAPLNEQPPARLARDLIKQLVVHCPHGCKWTGQLQYCGAHLSVCPLG